MLIRVTLGRAVRFTWRGDVVGDAGLLSDVQRLAGVQRVVGQQQAGDQAVAPDSSSAHSRALRLRLPLRRLLDLPSAGVDNGVGKLVVREVSLPQRPDEVRDPRKDTRPRILVDPQHADDLA